MKDKHIDMQRCIHAINTYGNQTEKDICDNLRTMTWEMKHTCHEAQNCLNEIERTHIIKLAMNVKERNLDKDDWFMDFL